MPVIRLSIVLTIICLCVLRYICENTCNLTALQTVSLGEYKMGKKEERFEVIYADGSQIKDAGMRQILVDTETGVNYLIWKSGYAGGITPLLDSQGKVVITK